MFSLADPSAVKVYTVNGASSSSSSSLPDWLTRKRAVKEKGKKRAVREQVEGSLELIQHFEFPEASNRIKTTRDGHHAIATGTYKPQMRCWDLDQLSLKFERHSDAENVDFIMLSDDWTKSIHLQNDRTIELHTQGGLHYKTRIPKFGRALAYHFPSCDALFAASGPEVFRLNLDQGRYLSPLVVKGDGDEEILGVNVIDINRAHHLLAFGVDGNGTVELWDPRSRTRVGLLRLPKEELLPVNAATSALLPGIDDDRPPPVSVTAISSRMDGLSYALGTSTGHTLLYDIRSPKSLATKDQGYGLPVKNVCWIEGGSRMAGDGLVLSADKKVIKIWDRNSSSANFTSVTPAADINDVHHISGSGLLMLANEGINMTTYYIPQLGPAPRWCSFLENLTEEMEDQSARTAYHDYKFVERSELTTLGLDHLIGTPALKPYMHGYFLSLQLYDTARVIANPFAYAEHREKVVKEKMNKLSETRIRTRKNMAGIKVNKSLAEKIRKEEERENRKAERKKVKIRNGDSEGEHEMDVDVNVDVEAERSKEKRGQNPKPNLLNDPRFKALFENPEFQVDEDSREFALLNPSTAFQKRNGVASIGSSNKGKTRTAVEEEEEESEHESSDGLSHSDDDSQAEESKSEDSDDAGELWHDSIRARLAARDSFIEAKKRARSSQRTPNVRLVPMQARSIQGGSRIGDNRNASFGQRRSMADTKGKQKADFTGQGVRATGDGGMEVSWVPSSKSNGTLEDDDEAMESSSRGGKKNKGQEKDRRKKGIEIFGAGMEKGGEAQEAAAALSESERSGRMHRRKGMRSGSKNTFRRM